MVLMPRFFGIICSWATFGTLLETADQLKSMLTIAPTAVVCEGARLVGRVTVGAGTVVHPTAQIVAGGRPIVIGDNCVVEEMVVISTAPAPASAGAASAGAAASAGVASTGAAAAAPAAAVPGERLAIGGLNLFEVGCRLEDCASVGSCNVFEPKAVVTAGCAVANGVTIGATVVLPAGVVVDDNSVVFRSGPDTAAGAGGRPGRRHQPRAQELNAKAIARYLQVLRDPASRSCLTNFHKLIAGSSCPAPAAEAASPGVVAGVK